MIKDISAVLYDERQIQKRIKELGENISKDYPQSCPVLLCILKGASLFMADLMRAITVHVEIDFMAISSYGDSTKSSGVVKIKKDVDVNLFDRDVIIVEDIVDSGLSLQYIKEYISKHNPKSVVSCVLLDKPSAHKVDSVIEYIGFEVGNEFVVGYGLDYAQKYRNLPFIGILKEEVYS
ncbi:MAG: hypoxanthine phosphoribosyltransferase [Candidatus Cloacimonetes bacterium 4572_65]|nr:MAG: hypoxanthine phosphoribosyltransferase [Candidatus Cloacimonetes bacterium 4572_65]